jgi:hypothetical protein
LKEIKLAISEKEEYCMVLPVKAPTLSHPHSPVNLSSSESKTLSDSFLRGFFIAFLFYLWFDLCMTKRRRGGRPTKFDKKMIEQAGILCSKHGYTDKKLAAFFFVTEQTVNNWKKAHPEFFESLKESKLIADDQVERSLYERATGYEHPEDKIFANGDKALVVPTVKHYPPDVTACIFWLKNRKPEDWRENREKEALNDGKEEALREVISNKPG